jgi:hypothetical protein
VTTADLASKRIRLRKLADLIDLWVLNQIILHDGEKYAVRILGLEPETVTDLISHQQDIFAKAGR